jgi:signal transduction histidine kinase
MNHSFYLKKFQTRLMVALCLMILISSGISFGVSTVLNNRELRQEIEADQHDVAVYALELYQKTHLAASEIANISTTAIYQVEVVEDISGLNLDAAQLNRLETGEVVSIVHKFLNLPLTYFKAGGSFFQVGIRSHVNVFRKVSIRASSTLLICTFSFFLFVFLSTRRMLRPISRLTEATRKVAEGDFTVRLTVKRQDELGQLMDNFNHMAQELQSIEYLQKDFISNVSHEFKTPIASIQGFATLLKSPETTEEERQEYTSIIIKESKRLSRLSQNLLRLSKLEYQQRLTSDETFSLDEQLRQTVLLLEPEWAPKELSWDVNLENTVIHGDAELLQQVWINLLGNAIKFSPQGGEIALSLYVSDVVKVRIRDQGIGMDEATQARIFERFYQGDTSHAHEGNGLGLPLAKRIIDLHGGALRVKSSPGKGSTFTVELKRADPPERSFP